jgi:hypothetical protein
VFHLLKSEERESERDGAVRMYSKRVGEKGKS